MADKKPGRGMKKKGKKEPKVRAPLVVERRSSKRDRLPTRVRLHEGKTVTPVKYSGSAVGHGNYTAGLVNGVMVLDGRGKPIPFRDFPQEPKVHAES